MPEPPLTILVADDSALYRQMLVNVLRRCEGVEVVGVAADGGDTVAKVASLRPDVVTLDVRMPVLNGIDVLRALRKQGSTTRVIMVSSLTGDGDPTTVEALLEGAFDYVLKPVGLDPHLARESLRTALAEKLTHIRALLRPHAAPAATPVSISHDGRPTPARLPFDAVAIGTSTGGPEALRAILPALPADLPVPVLLVQHMPPHFTATLATRLDEMSAISVVEAATGMPVQAGRVHVAAGGKHLRVAVHGPSASCATDEGPPRHGCRPSFDVLLESLVEAHGGRVLAVVLTGMGCDGLEGCTRLKQRGGTVIAQSPASCAVYGMPKAVIEHGLADAILPLDAIARFISAAVSGRLPHRHGGQPSTSESTSSAT